MQNWNVITECVLPVCQASAGLLTVCSNFYAFSTNNICMMLSGSCVQCFEVISEECRMSTHLWFLAGCSVSATFNSGDHNVVKCF